MRKLIADNLCWYTLSVAQFLTFFHQPFSSLPLFDGVHISLGGKWCNTKSAIYGLGNTKGRAKENP
jgi:hypothetical protein